MKRMFFSCLIDLNWRPDTFEFWISQIQRTPTLALSMNCFPLNISASNAIEKVTFTHEPLKKGRLDSSFNRFHTVFSKAVQSPRKNRPTKTRREITFKAAASHFSTNSEFILLLLLTEDPSSASFRSYRLRAFRYCLCLSNLLRSSRVAMFRT